ncbi:MAG: hypothetical protein KKH44_08775 [Bacteroidetes bacterium]|nr:hypothetical protein [Bacteroidota bacterium]
MEQYKYICLDKNGFPVEGIIGKPILNFFRKLFLTRKIVKGILHIGVDIGSKDDDCTCYSIINPNGKIIIVAFDKK